LGSINAVLGDELKCNKCGHSQILTSSFLAKILKKHFPERIGSTLYVSDLKRFKCVVCNSKETKLIENRHNPLGQFMNEKNEQLGQMCRQCGGDGGINNRCPRCSGNGFEPSK
jgi:hypothetical protein